MGRIVFINKKGKLEVKPDEKELKVSEYGVAYIIRDKNLNESDDEHQVYKLHQIGSKWYWIGLWNSIVMAVEEKGCKSMKIAIKAAIEEGYTVEEVSFDGSMFCNPID